MATNKIIVYRGGGYDGCFWEPNAFMFGPNKEFIDLGSQGRHAIKDMETATAKYKEIKGGFGDKDEAIYDVFSKKQMVSLCEDYASVYLRKFVAEALQVYDNVTDEKILKRLQLGFYCSKCKCCITDVEEVHFVNVQSFGGIMIAATDMLCNNCYDNGTCYDCREEGNDDEDSYYPEEVAKNGGHCNYHYENCVVKRLKEHCITRKGVGIQLNDLQDTIERGEYQYKELCRMRGVEQDDKLWGQHKASVEDIKAQMVELWKSLSREERDEILE